MLEQDIIQLLDELFKHSKLGVVRSSVGAFISLAKFGMWVC